MNNDFNFTVSEENKNKRLDIFIAKMLPDLSRSRIQKLITSGAIKVNGKEQKSNYKIQVNDNISGDIPEAESLDIKPEDLELDIVYEDNHIIVINKPRGMVVHPAAGNYQGTLVNALLKHCDDLSGINGVKRPGIVHRLDKDTSGVMVVAKTDQAHLNLAKQIKERTASRVYLAIVDGNITEEKGMIDAPIGRHPKDRKKMAVSFTNSKEAITKFKVLERYGEYTLIECKLLTGRTHQIRVHMAYIGHPVVADPQYGSKRCEFNIKGQALHSFELKLEHPVDGKRMSFVAPLPIDMQEIIGTLRKRKDKI